MQKSCSGLLLIKDKKKVEDEWDLNRNCLFNSQSKTVFDRDSWILWKTCRYIANIKLGKNVENDCSQLILPIWNITDIQSKIFIFLLIL